jgi:hypothetical protein
VSEWQQAKLIEAALRREAERLDNWWRADARRALLGLADEIAKLISEQPHPSTAATAPAKSSVVSATAPITRR